MGDEEPPPEEIEELKAEVYAFVLEREGNELKGYIPKDNKGVSFPKSGVTIGAGVDLGQFTAI